MWARPYPFLLAHRLLTRLHLTPNPLLFLLCQQRLQLLGLHFTARARRQRRQRQYQIKIVIGGNTIKALKIATQATMYDHILLVRTLETTYRLHPAPASAHPVSWFPVIDMQRIEAERAVITMTPSAVRRAYKTTAVFTLKNLFRGLLITGFATIVRAIIIILFTIVYIVTIASLLIQTQKLLA